MPELPDITIYVEALEQRLIGRELRKVALSNPFLLRTVEPSLAEMEGRRVERVARVGKRIALGFTGDLWVVIHLMIAGRLHWYPVQGTKKTRPALARFDFEHGTLTLTEAGSKRRASLHVVRGKDNVEAMGAGGLEIFAIDLPTFTARLTSENHTLKRALTDPRLFSGIGNAYSDEILHRARLSPLALTQKLAREERERLFVAVKETLTDWTVRLRADAAGGFPEKVTAFRKDMAVHGRYGEPCRVCGTRIQRIRYAENETDYCPRCQTGGRLLADRALSRLLKADWPRSIDELERLKQKNVR